MTFRRLTKEEAKDLQGKIDRGEIKEVHLYNPENILRPRGGVLQKESLGLTILEKLISYYESWTDPRYEDNPDENELLRIMQRNLSQEVEAAWDAFMEEDWQK